MNKTDTQKVLDALKLLDPELTFENWENGDGEEISEQLRSAAALCEASLARVVEPVDLSEPEIEAIARTTESAEPGNDGWILPYTFAREIITAINAKAGRP